jgi:DNA-binding NarL/FixJ family response regulator
MRIFVADDHPLILRGIADLLSGSGEADLVGYALDTNAEIEGVTQLRPDILIQDLAMAGVMSAIQAMRYLRKLYPEMGIVALAENSSVALAWEVLEQGATAYVTKVGNCDELMKGILSASKGQRYVGEPLSDCALEQHSDQVRKGHFRSFAELTPREITVMQLIAQGLKTSEIASRLRIGRRTVESHRAGVLAKLGLRNQVDVTRFAIERGLVR